MEGITDDIFIEDIDVMPLALTIVLGTGCDGEVFSSTEPVSFSSFSESSSFAGGCWPSWWASWIRRCLQNNVSNYIPPAKEQTNKQKKKKKKKKKKKVDLLCKVIGARERFVTIRTRVRSFLGVSPHMPTRPS